MSEDTQKKEFPFKIDEVAGKSLNQKVTASYLIKYAEKNGIPAAKKSPNSITLKGSHGSYSGDDVIDLSQDYIFTIEVKEKRGPYFFEVNGEGLQSERQKLTAQEIIDLARASGLVFDLNSQLESGDREFGADEVIDLTQFHEFATIPTGSGDVA